MKITVLRKLTPNLHLKSVHFQNVGQFCMNAVTTAFHFVLASALIPASD